MTPDELPTERLDDEHVLEPVVDGAQGPLAGEPLVRDASGGVWRVRRVSGPADWAAPIVAALALAGLILLLALDVL